MVNELKAALREKINPEKAAFFPKFFKTGPGQYGEGDKFLGITVSNQRLVAKQFKDLSLADVQALLKSEWHEERLTALLILVKQFQKADTQTQKNIYEFYLKNTQYINNWDLVDTSARDIIGGYIFYHPELLNTLDDLAHSTILWERRIAMLASYYFLMKGDPDVTVKLAKILLHDSEDLMHKAVGWMLREMGKRCEKQLLVDFLDMHAHEMPRTTLRYAVEHFDANTRHMYMEKN